MTVYESFTVRVHKHPIRQAWLCAHEPYIDSPDGRFSRNLSGQDGFGGGQKIVPYADGFVFARYRFISALFANVYRLMTFKTTDRTTAEFCQAIISMDSTKKHTRLHAAIDTYGLPTFGFVHQHQRSEVFTANRYRW